MTAAEIRSNIFLRLIGLIFIIQPSSQITELMHPTFLMIFRISGIYMVCEGCVNLVRGVIGNQQVTKHQVLICIKAVFSLLSIPLIMILIEDPEIITIPFLNTDTGKFYLIDIGITCEHFVLEAEELGLGSCWIGWFNERAVKSVLNIPQNKKIDIMIALGYYDREKLGPEHSREPMDKIASFNSY